MGNNQNNKGMIVRNDGAWFSFSGNGLEMRQYTAPVGVDAAGLVALWRRARMTSYAGACAAMGLDAWLGIGNRPILDRLAVINNWKPFEPVTAWQAFASSGEPFIGLAVEASDDFACGLVGFPVYGGPGVHDCAEPPQALDDIDVSLWREWISAHNAATTVDQCVARLRVRA